MHAAETTPPPSPPNLWPAARGLAIATMAAVALVVAHGWINHAQREKLESYSERTAVGDDKTMPLPDMATALTQPLLIFRGEPLYATSDKPYGLRDIEMKFVGKDDTGQWRLYQSPEAVKVRRKELDRPGVPAYFVKHAHGRYLRVQPMGKK